MKVFTEKTVIRQELTDVRCNKCGRALQINEAGYFEDYFQATKSWGYHSPMDGETHEFDLCSDCYKEMIDGFSIKPFGEAEEVGS